MTITFDGERSKSRRWFAKKLLNIARQMNLPALRKVWDGFTFSVTDVGSDIEAARVTAPDGMVVACVSPGNVSVCSSEYWLHSVTPARAVNRFDGEKPLGHFNFYPVAFDSAPNSKLIPSDTYTIFPVSNNTYTDSPPKVALSPFIGEWYSIAYNMICTDAAYGVGYEAFFYLATGEQSKRLGVFGLTDDSASTFWFANRCPDRFGSSIYLCGWGGKYRWNPYQPDGMVCLFKVTVRLLGNRLAIVRPQFYYGQIMFYQLPGALINYLVREEPNYTRSLGGYGFSTNKDRKPILLHAVDATHTELDTLYFNHNPSQIQWKCFICIFDEENLTILNFGAAPFVEAFYNLSGVKGGADNAFPNTYPPAQHAMWTAKINNMKLWRPGGGDGIYEPIYRPVYDNADPPNIIRYERTGWKINWNRVRYGVAQWFAWPNTSGWVPYDSAMFYDHNGNVLTWTRLFGTVRINNTDGAVRVNIHVPLVALHEEGVRPEIYLIEGSLYWCRCVQEKWGVRGLYYGSPYTGWSEIPNSTGYRMVEVRLVKWGEEPKKRIFIAVFWDGAEYYTGIFANEKWKITGKIKGITSPPEVTTWSMSLYGDGVLAKAMQSALASPPATPQFRVCGVYSEYEDMIP